MKNKFINTPSIHIEHDGKTFNSNTLVKFFPPETIFSMVDFTENYTFAAQNEIQSEYYHFDQVSIFFHVLYRNAQHSVDDIESMNDNRHVIKEYHFYISDDRMHDMHYVKHCFDIIYGSLKIHGIVMN